MFTTDFAAPTGHRAAKRCDARYSRHVGRVGALAVALGVGFAVATTPGLAWANPETESNAPGGPDSEAPSTPKVDPSSTRDAGPAAPAPADTPPVADPPAGSQSEVTVGGGDGPTVIIRSSGGAHPPSDGTELHTESDPGPVAVAEPAEVTTPPAPSAGDDPGAPAPVGLDNGRSQSVAASPKIEADPTDIPALVSAPAPRSPRVAPVDIEGVDDTTMFTTLPTFTTFTTFNAATVSAFSTMTPRPHPQSRRHSIRSASSSRFR